ncbi:MAG: hypothetical protein J0I06_07715 [Planctomycetes bacterium]|nr:hypothetical protein [Planctomycetota bacterium]
MSRASRVPYHQNVYDLLQIEPNESPEAARMIAEHEAKHGPLPATLREWYLVPNARVIWACFHPEHLRVLRLEQVLANFANPISTPDGPRAVVLQPDDIDRHYALVDVAGYEDPVLWWHLRTRGTDGPDTESDGGGRQLSEFLESLAFDYARWCAEDNPDLVLRGGEGPDYVVVNALKPHANGLWFRTPDDPFQPPVIDFLTDQFGEPDRTPRPGHVTTYTFRPPGGTIRVTADEPTLTGALSAWWVHADAPERLAAFAELLAPWGTLRDTLRADTDPARNVLKRVRGGAG